MMDLRPYQKEAVEAITREWSSGNKKTLLVLPTGTGKTIVFSQIIRECVKKGERVLVLAHRGELLEQAQDKLYHAFGLRAALEKAENTAQGAWERVTVGSVQTLMRQGRLDRFATDYYDTIIVDEAHHILSPSYQTVLEHFSSAKVLGVTATPDRGDMKNLGTYFDSLSYQYSLPKAIQEGFLCKIKALSIPLSIDLTGVSIQAGDYQAASVGHALEPYLEAIAEQMCNYCQDRKTVVFLPLVAISQKFCEILKNKGFRAAEVNGESDDRKEILEDFDRGAYDVLCNAMLLTEGWDCPSVDTIVVLRPTKVRSLYSQMVGRGTRLSPGKDHLLLLDFLWLTDRHDLCHPVSLIAEDEKVAQKATAMIAESDGAMDIIEAVEEGEQETLRAREEALAAELASMRKRKKRLVDPLQYELSINAEDLVNYVPAFGWEMEEATEKQIQMLEKHGVFADASMSKGKAKKLIDRLVQRQEVGLATPKQIRLLERYGFQKVGTWQFSAAQSMIGRIASNNWRLPYGFSSKSYLPGNEVMYG